MGACFLLNCLVQTIAVSCKSKSAEFAVQGIPGLIIIKNAAKIVQTVCPAAEIIVQVIRSKHPLAFRDLGTFQYLIVHIISIQVLNIGFHRADILRKLLCIIRSHNLMVPLIHMAILQYDISTKTQ